EEEVKKKETTEKKSTNPSAHASADYKKLHQQKTKAFQKAEEELEKLKAQLRQIETQLADPEVYADKAKFQSLDEQYKKLSAQTDSQTAAYETLFEEMMELEQKIAE